MRKTSLGILLILCTMWSISGCGGGGGGGGSIYAEKCQSSCDPSMVMACAANDSTACERDCESLTAGLTAVCATCLTQKNAWQYNIDNRSSGPADCRGYGFPSVTDTSAKGCASACR